LHDNHGTRRRDFSMGLLQSRNPVVRISEIPIILSIDTDDPVQRLRYAGPVFCWTIGQPIGWGPDAEVRVMYHERRRWSAEANCGLLLRCGSDRDEDAAEVDDRESKARRWTCHFMPSSNWALLNDFSQRAVIRINR
jgi:hypothetical protein